jgi:hypothetical protein
MEQGIFVNEFVVFGRRYSIVFPLNCSGEIVRIFSEIWQRLSIVLRRFALFGCRFPTVWTKFGPISRCSAVGFGRIWPFRTRRVGHFGENWQRFDRTVQWQCRVGRFNGVSGSFRIV